MTIGAAVAAALLGSILSASVHGQGTPRSTGPTAGATSDQDLAKSVHNPFEDFIKVPVQSTTGLDLGGHHGSVEALNIEPLIPLRLNPQWDLIAQPSLSAIYLPGAQQQFGLGDLQTSFFLTPHKEAVWVWGAGPILQFPTASSAEFGTGRWSVGPTAALVYSKGPWFNGIVVYQLLSVGGSRERSSVNQTGLEPDVSYNFDSGWYLQWQPAITYDWTVESGNAWTVPMGADIGKAFTFGSQALSLQVGAYDFLKHADGAPNWIFRVSVTLLYPEPSR